MLKQLTSSGNKWGLHTVLEIDWTTAFKKDLKKFKHDHKLLEELDSVIKTLANLHPLPARCRDHGLIGNSRKGGLEFPKCTIKYKKRKCDTHHLPDKCNV